MGDFGPILLGVGGLAWGYVADRIGARWPAHEDGSVRRIDWRTFVVMALGGLAFVALAWRVHQPQNLFIFGFYLGALVLLLATDLDQKLLPDIITFPLAGYAALLLLLDVNPFVPRGEVIPAVVGAIGLPLLLFALSIPFGRGAIGMGDLKLLVSVGLIAGLYRAVLGVVAGALLAGLVILILLVARRVTLKTYVPFGPFLIVGAAWSLFVGG